MSTENPNRALISTWFFALGTLALLLSILSVGRDFLIPLAINGLLFILSSALVEKIQSAKLFGWSPPGWLAQVLSIVLIIGALLVLGSIVSSSAEEIQDALPEYRKRLTEFGTKLEGFLGPKTVETLRRAVEDVDIGSLMGAVVSQFGGALSTIGLVVLYLAFLVSERLAWVRKLPLLVSSQEGARHALDILTKISTGVKQYMWVNAVTSAMSGTVAYVIFKIVGLDFAELLALTVFIAGFIPNIGAFIAITLPSFVALIQFDSLTPFLVVLFGYGAADQFIANVIQPSMQGRSLNLSTFMVMVSLTFWASIWGGIGAFLAIPMMVVAMVICAEIPAIRWIAVLLSGDGQLWDARGADAEYSDLPD